ncbi:MAG: aminopeptidase [Bdellovibrionaceae bacterium]|nr:aminopeptidase [Pseudobdellovibrionaceae bacterium]
MKKKWLQRLGLGLSAFMISGCQLGYLVDTARHHYRVMNKRIPVDEALQSSSLTDEQKRKLRLSQEARQFAQKLGLKVSKNYSLYTQLDQPYVTYVVRVSPEYDLSPHTWWFPIIGSVPYKGFPTKKQAEQEAKKFPEDQFDTYVRGVSAYSTLGYFVDPILSSMLRYSDYDLVNLIIHESVHATIYISSAADFNERLANFIGDLGAELYFKKIEGQDSPTLEQLSQSKKNQQRTLTFLSQEVTDLAKWYKDNKGKLSPEKKQQRFQQIKSRYKDTVAPHVSESQSKAFLKTPLNNARLASFRTYSYNMDEFERAYAKLGSDFDAFLTFAKSLEDADDPEKSLKDFASPVIR